jgi:hypothetical protein
VKNFTIIAFIALFTATLFGINPAHAEVKPLIKSTVVDIDGKPVKGAYIFFYDSPDTKRAVDLVSPVTNKKGYCQK